MAGAKNVVQRPGSTFWYARLEVPVDVREQVGQSQKWKSLRTRDLREARLRALPVLTAWRAEFDELRRRRHPTPEDLQAGVWAHYEAQLERDQLERASLPTDADRAAASAKLQADIEAGLVEWSDDPMVQLNATLELRGMVGAADFLKDSRARRITVLRSHLATGETALIHWAADDLILREKLLIEKGSPVYRDLCQRLQRAELQYLERAAGRDRGHFTGMPTDASVKPADPTMGKKRAAAGETIMELYDQFKADQIGSSSADTWKGNRGHVQLFAEFVGESSHVSAITRTAIRDWKLKLAQWPTKAEQKTVFKGMSFRKVIDANETLGHPPISDFTRNKYLSALSTFTKWLLRHEYIDSDVASGMHLKLDKKKKKGHPFSGAQLKTILSSPLFANCMGDKREHEVGNIQIRDWRYWMPWIALYSGARLGEIAQLTTKDIREEHGVWIFHVAEEGDDEKSTKASGSMRVIPIHSELIKLGLLDYHAAIVKAGEARVFPELQRDTRGYFGSASGFFNHYFRAIGVKDGRNVNFHSFRHAMTDGFRNAGYYDEQFNVLLRRTKETTTGRYGNVPEGILSERVKMIEAVKFDLKVETS
jgi:integrase